MGREKMRVLVTGHIPQEIVDLLRKEHEVEVHTEDRPMERGELLQSVKDKQGLLCMITDKVDKELLNAAAALKMVANCAVGFDNIDVQALSERGIPVSNTPGVLTETTADLAFTLILATARRVVEGDRRVRSGEFKFMAPFLFLGREVQGKTLGIIGLGRIGKAVARRGLGFNMRVLYYGRHPLDAAEEKTLNLHYASLQELLSDADFVSIHVPLNEETRHLIGPGELDLMKPGAFLINTSRGPIVDEEALVQALKEGKIAGAGLDVYEKEPLLTPGLAELPHVVLLPHVGSATWETRTKMAALAAENLLMGLKGGMPPDCINREAVSRKA